MKFFTQNVSGPSFLEIAPPHFFNLKSILLLGLFKNRFSIFPPKLEQNFKICFTVFFQTGHWLFWYLTWAIFGIWGIPLNWNKISKILFYSSLPNGPLIVLISHLGNLDKKSRCSPNKHDRNVGYWKRCGAPLKNP